MSSVKPFSSRTAEDEEVEVEELAPVEELGWAQEDRRRPAIPNMPNKVFLL